MRLLDPLSIIKVAKSQFGARKQIKITRAEAWKKGLDGDTNEKDFLRGVGGHQI